MYYADNEKKEYEKREFFNIHPKVWYMKFVVLL